MFLNSSFNDRLKLFYGPFTHTDVIYKRRQRGRRVSSCS